MSVSNKHLATILLGAAAAFGAYKYSKMTEEEKQKMSDSLKDKFHKLKDEAEKAGDTAKNYFSDLKNKATEMFKEHFPGAGQHFDDFYKGGSTEDAAGNVSTSPTTEVNPGA
jgi:septation ring formation regulator EzrA